jgi:hypothetical protein
MSSSLRKATLAGISITPTAGRARNAHATHVGVGQQAVAACAGHRTLLKQFLIDLAVASVLLWGLIMYAIWDQMPQPTTFERMSYSISP